jgi:hypothetical protein
LIAVVLNADPAIHSERSTGKTNAASPFARTRPRSGSSKSTPAAAGGYQQGCRERSRCRYSQPVEYWQFAITADGDRSITRAYRAAAPEQFTRGRTLAHSLNRLKSIG